MSQEFTVPQCLSSYWCSHFWIISSDSFWGKCCTWKHLSFSISALPTFRSLSFLRLHSSHSLTMRPQRIQVSSSRCDRLEEAEELDTNEEPLLRREPLIERMDLESASNSLKSQFMRTESWNYNWLFLMEKAHDYKSHHVCLIQDGAQTGEFMRFRNRGGQTVTLWGSV